MNVRNLKLKDNGNNHILNTVYKKFPNEMH